ncbi:TENA/THI-4/PQQC family protein [Saccharopolyspora erythraea NRRL 2338]|nr:transcriptional regulator [Saccharopolyspora erythraea]PFG96288.1 TENA/THI-4/PQQC family protein [Saccharopolyspora erythraea NRRL 2338]QRK92807.1 transcriptional regulator [Saccharopolyspora erythraea]
MTASARALLESVQQDLAPQDDDNRLVPLVRDGRAPRAVLAALAAEEHRIVASDWRSFLTLAGRATDEPTREFFAGLAQGEGVALKALPVLASALGMDREAVRAYRPQAGCQAYPAYVAWLALNAEPADAVVGVVANFAAWGQYCASIAKALRSQYGLDDDACAFFDMFASPPPEAQEQALAAVQAGIDAGRVTDAAREYGRLFQSYELMFWNTLADQAG